VSITYTTIYTTTPLERPTGLGYHPLEILFINLKLDLEGEAKGKGKGKGD
jgi:hypothetical protein